jgi:hypothetical protein
MSTTYDTDFYAWATEQAALLRAGRLDQANIGNIAEEIESMGRIEKRELVNRLSVLLLHSLKWQAQPTGRCTSWRLSIEEQRDRLTDHLADNPSLKATLPVSIDIAYRLAVLGAARETGIDRTTFAAAGPWRFDEIAGPEFWQD